MGRTTRAAAVALAALLAASCAATGGDHARVGTAAAPAADIDALSRALETEKDGAALAALLFRRGHAYLEEAERLRGTGRAEGKPAPGSVEASRLLLGALADFEDLAQNFPGSPDAPEALFHLGVIYDYPNLASFTVARRYYARTIERYPGSESARKARAAIERIDAAARGLGEGRHGGR